MSLNKWNTPVCLALVLFVSMPGVARLDAQGPTAAIQGTVTDPSGAAVVGAAVEVTNVDTGLSQTVATNNQGRYTVPVLAIGNYRLQASQAGFETVVHSGITLSVGSASVVDFALQVGQQQQTVTVQGEVSQVETTSSTVSSLVDQTQMRELPLNGRNFEQLILLAPGVQQFTGETFGSFWGRATVYSFSGSRPEGQALLLDNQDIQNFWGHGTGSPTLGTSLGVDAISEFQVLTSTYSAQYGGAGAVMNSVSKSGTNGFHGSGFEFLRNSYLDARNFFDGAKIAPFRKNQYGSTFGGPVKKDKAFFFVNYEGVRQLLGETKVVNTPDAAHRTVTATNAATAAEVEALLALYPLPTTPSNANGVGQYVVTANQPAYENYVLARFDYTFNSKDSFFVRYLSDRVQLTEPVPMSPLPLWPESDNTRNQFALIEERHIVSSTIVNSLRAYLSRPVEQGTSVGSVAADNFFPGTGRQNGDITISGLSALGPAATTPYNFVASHYGEADDVIWTHGSHSVKVGVSVLREDTNGLNFHLVGGVWSFNSLSQLLAGTATTFSAVLPGAAYGNRDLRSTQFAPYIHDDWKVTSKLTLNMGVRYEFVTNPIDVHNQLWEIVNPPFSPAGCTDLVPTSCFTHVSHVFQNGNPTRTNFDPRIGVAFDPFKDHKTSIRSGFGLFHDLIDYHSYLTSLWSSPPETDSVQNFPTFPTPFSSTSANPLNDNPAFNYNINATPYVLQWNLTVQREILPNTILSIGYSGSRGVHLLTPIDENPAVPTIQNGVMSFGTLVNGKIVPNARINPLFSYLYDDKAIGLSSYHGMPVALNRRFTTNATAQLSYTWSHCTDLGSGYTGSEGTNNGFNQNPFNLSGDKGNCAFDVRHTLRINGLYSLPFHGNKFVEGWQISGIETFNTGVPISPTMGFDNMGDGGGATPRPNVVPGCNLYAGYEKPTNWFNPNCFSQPTPGTPGNSGRTNLVAPGLVNTDFSVLKDTRIPKISEQFDVQFRAEFFNIFNHANFAIPSGAIFSQTSTGGAAVSATAGQVTATVGTSRQIQFGVKILF